MRQTKFYSSLVCAWLLLGTGYAQAQANINELLGTAVACAITEEALADMPVQSLYHADLSSCQAGNPLQTSAAQWFTDSACTNPVNFIETPMREYCQTSLDKATLGNAVDIVPDSWTLSPGNRLDVGARRLEGVTQPYMQRSVYKTITNERGECQLEMRVYSKYPEISDQRALLALHGGSWTSRGFGYFGLELTVPHFVDQGFVVFAPFYRLLGDRESTAACNQAGFEQITDDANSALDWVLENAQQYGANGLPVLFGQSAGGHLAVKLAVDRAESASAAVLMYPPTDFGDFLQRVQQGFYTNAEGLSILERVVGGTVETSSPDSPLIYENSFPLRIQSENVSTPPMMIVQGMKDELVEPRQALRLCQALAGESLLDTSAPVDTVEDVAFRRACGSHSLLYLLRDGSHALDVCLNEQILSACPSGGKESRDRIASIVTEAVQFAADASMPDGSTRRSGGGAVHWSILLLWLVATAGRTTRGRVLLNYS